MNVNLWNSMPIKVHLIHRKLIETISMGKDFHSFDLWLNFIVDCFRNKTNSSQRRKGPVPTPLLTTNGQSDFDSGDETQQIPPGYNNETFTR